jgi:hypothetical protein
MQMVRNLRPVKTVRLASLSVLLVLTSALIASLERTLLTLELPSAHRVVLGSSNRLQASRTAFLATTVLTRIKRLRLFVLRALLVDI